jgi:xanthine dehydrogenase accessory factor
MNWLSAVETLRRERRPGVLITVVSVRGHAPRDPGAKMVVAADDVWGTIGGGNLEETAVARARELLEQSAATPELATMQLNDKAHVQYGRQCCGGQVTYLLEPLAVVPSVAIFGMGHVGLELARILSRHDLELYCVDSRVSQLEPERLRCLDGAIARVHVQHAAVPELVLGTVPRGTHVLILTHDHAEDFALCDAALRCGHLGPIGLIGSSVKRTRFRHKLADEGHSPEAIDRITSPIGLAGLPGKAPAAIAVSVAADLLQSFALENSKLLT